MGLPLKIGLGFIVALGVGIVVFGNIIAPPKMVNFEQSSEAIRVVPVESTRYVNPSTSGRSDNLTKHLASGIGKNIVDLNPEGPLNKKLTVEQAQIIAEKTLNESLQKIDASRFAPLIPLETVTIADNSHYTADLAILLKEHTDALRQKQPTDSSLHDIDTALSVYHHSLAQLQQLPTPEKYASKQQSILSILQGQIHALRALQDYENDPIQGLVALQAFIDAQKKLTALIPKLSS